MKIVIDIPEGMYNELRTCKFPIQDAYRLCVVIENGKPYEERKFGKFVTEKIGIRSYHTKCSECGTVFHTGHNFDDEKQYLECLKERLNDVDFDKYCHECGAKMEGAGDETEKE